MKFPSLSVCVCLMVPAIFTILYYRLCPNQLLQYYLTAKQPEWHAIPQMKNHCPWRSTVSFFLFLVLYQPIYCDHPTLTSSSRIFSNLCDYCTFRQHRLQMKVGGNKSTAAKVPLWVWAAVAIWSPSPTVLNKVGKNDQKCKVKMWSGKKERGLIYEHHCRMCLRSKHTNMHKCIVRNTTGRWMTDIMEQTRQQPRLRILLPSKIRLSEYLNYSRHTTLSGTPGGGKERFLGGGPRRCDLLSNRHSPIFPYVSSPWNPIYFRLFFCINKK